MLIFRWVISAPCCNKQGAVDSLVHYLFYCSGPDSSFDEARKLTGFSLRPIQHAILDLAPVDPPSSGDGDTVMNPDLFTQLPPGLRARSRLTPERILNFLLIQRSSRTPDRFDNLFLKRVRELTGTDKSTLRKMIGTTFAGKFNSEHPVQEGLLCLLARFLICAQRDRNSALWANFGAGIQVNAAKPNG
jgi:hypothetical protein